MSSHHFVKEGQEPALFIVQVISFEMIEPLLEWAPLVLADEPVLDEVLGHGIKIDAVLTPDVQAADVREKVAAQWPVEIVHCDTVRDVLAQGIAFLLEKNQRALNVVVHTSPEIFSEAEQYPQLGITLLDGRQRWVFCRDGSYEKWLPAGTALALYSHDARPVFHGATRPEIQFRHRPMAL